MDAKGTRIPWSQKYETAIEHFLEADDDYRRVLSLFPRLHRHLQPLAAAVPPNLRDRATALVDIPIQRPDFRETHKYTSALKAFVQFLSKYRQRFYDARGQVGGCEIMHEVCLVFVIKICCSTVFFC